MRTDVVRLGAISAGLAFVLVVVGTVLTGDIDPYQDDVAQLLAEIEDAGGMFPAGTIVVALGLCFLIPLGLGLYYCAAEHDRPFAVVSLIFFATAVTAGAAQAAFGVALADIAGGYVDAGGATQEAFVVNGNAMQSLYVVSQILVFFSLGVALLTTGILSLRTDFFPRPVAWFTLLVAVGGLSGGFLWPIIVFGLPIWLLVIGIFMWRRSAPAVVMPASAAT